MSSFKERLQFLWGDAKPAQIARDLNWSISGVLRIFEKDTIPKAGTLVSIQKLKGCDWNWLMTGEGVPFPKEAADAHPQHASYLAAWLNILKPFVFIALAALNMLGAAMLLYFILFFVGMLMQYEER